MNEFLLVLSGGGISLVSSVAVTWLHSRHVHRGDVRAATRESTRQLTALFIAERDAALDGAGPTDSLAEAEMLSVALTDRRIRERVRDVIRLLRELHLPELQELSGQRAGTGSRLLCDHALEVLGAHYRGEKLPALPSEVQRMLTVEDEALSIHTGGASSAGTAAAAAGSSAPAKASTKAPANEPVTAPVTAPVKKPSARKDAKKGDEAKEPASTRKPGRRPRTSAAADPAEADASARRRDAAQQPKDPEDSDFWND